MKLIDKLKDMGKKVGERVGIIHPIKIEKLRLVYDFYKNLEIGQDFEVIMGELKDLRDIADKSGVELVFDTSDFYKYLRGNSVRYNKEGFYILDTGVCGFPDYLKAEKYSLTKENFKKVFPDNFTSEMFREGVLDYIKKIDEASTGGGPSKYERKLPISGFERLAKEAMKKKGD